MFVLPRDVLLTFSQMGNVPFDQSIYFEQGLLEGLPMASFDWDSWGQYFGRIMPPDGSLQQPVPGYSFQ
jgi:hypothetical protein